MVPHWSAADGKVQPPDRQINDFASDAKLLSLPWHPKSPLLQGAGRTCGRRGEVGETLDEPKFGVPARSKCLPI